jgi:hypothetical protein
MAGQPNIPGYFVFRVTNMWVGDDPDALVPANIVPEDEPFSLNVRFTGNGPLWRIMRTLRATYQVHFYVEGQGRKPEFNVPAVEGRLEPGQDVYTVEANVARGLPQPGVYKLSCDVVFARGWEGIATGRAEATMQAY